MTKSVVSTIAALLGGFSFLFCLSIPVWAPNNDAVWHHLLWLGMGLSYLCFGIAIVIVLVSNKFAK